MADNDVEWVKTWVRSINEREGHGLTEREIHKAAVIGEAGFSGNVGVGHAAKAGITATKRLRE